MLGKNTGAVAILVRTGYGTDSEDDTNADYVVDGLMDAARIIARAVEKSDDS